MNMNNVDLANHLSRTPGKVEVPVLLANDVIHIIAEKQDLIQRLRDCADASWFTVTETRFPESGISVHLEVND